jgi:hypothetical protein
MEDIVARIASPTAPLRWSRRATPPFAPPRATQTTAEECREVLANVEVDEDWYSHAYPDVREGIRKGNVVSGAAHFRKTGYYEERLPYRPYVDEDFYFEKYPDVLGAYREGRIISATEHFAAHGYREGRVAFEKVERLKG